MNNISLIDTHCHLDFDAFDEDREQVLNRSRSHNIADIIIPGTQKKHWNRIRDLCTSYKQLHPCYGLHPYWAQVHDRKDINELGRYIEANKPVAVGECGLDYRPQQAEKATQLYFFEAQMALALNGQLPIVIHSVRATDAVIDIIKRHKGIRGMIHSFSGSPEQARQLIDLGFYISISGSVTYENAKKIRATAKTIPLTSLLIETDAPDQPDKNHCSERNEPAYLTKTLETVAVLRDETVEAIAEQTTKNARALFNI